MLRVLAGHLRRSTPLIAAIALSSPLCSQTLPPARATPTDSAALNTSINGPTQLAFDDKSGSLYIVEWVGRRVLRLNIHDASIRVIVPKPYKESEDAFEFPQSIATNAQGDLYVADFNGRLRRIRAVSGEIDLMLASPPNPLGRWALAMQIEVDAEGNLFIADQMEHKMLRLPANRTNPETVAGIGSGGFSGDGGAATQARLMFPSGVALNRNGDMFIADYQNCRIRKVDKETRIITTIAGTGACKSGGDGRPAIQATVNYPSAMAADSKGNLFFVDGACVRKIDAAGGISTYAGTGEAGFSGDGGPADKAKLGPSGLAVDSDGNLYIAEFVNNRIRRVDARTHTISTVAGDGGPTRVDMLL